MSDDALETVSKEVIRQQLLAFDNFAKRSKLLGHSRLTHKSVKLSVVTDLNRSKHNHRKPGHG